jgi:hypothetical protein
MAEIHSEQNPKTFENADFGWDVDWPPICRAVAIFGGLLLLIGFVLWMVLPGVTGLNPSFTPRLGPFALAVFLGIGGVMAVFLGFTEEGVAVLAGAAVSVFVAFAFVYTQIPAGYPLLTNPGPYGTDFGVVLTLLVVGVAALVLGVVQSIRVYLTAIRDEGPRKLVPAHSTIPEKHP